jgi:hypothetical protein
MRASRWLLVALWALEIVSLILPGSPARILAMGGLVLYGVLLLPFVRRSSAIISVVALLVATALAYGAGEPSLLLDGLAFAIVFPAFLATIALTRAAAERNPIVIRVRDRLAEGNVASRVGATSIGAHLAGSVVTAGSFGVVAPLMPKGAPEEERAAAGSAAVRGTTLAVLWSPFFVGMAVTTAYVPHVPLWQITLTGLLMATAGLLGALWGFGRIGPASVPALLAPFRPMILVLVVLGGLVIAVASLTPLGTLEAVFLIVPPLIALWLVFEPRQTRRAVVREGWANLSGAADDLLVIASIMTFSRVLAGSGFGEPLIAAVAATPLPGGLVLSLLLVAVILVSVAGLHPMATIGSLLGLIAGQDEVFAGLAVAMLGVLGWGLGAMVGPTSLVVMMASATYRVSVAQIALRRNLVFVALFVPAMGVVLAILNAALVD